MSFADPTSVTINGVAISLAKIRDDGLTSEYNSVDGLHNLVISHNRLKSGRIKTIVKLTVFRNVVNPLTGLTVTESVTHQHSIDRPAYGWTATLLDQEQDGLSGLLTAANMTKLFGLEH